MIEKKEWNKKPAENPDFIKPIEDPRKALDYGYRIKDYYKEPIEPEYAGKIIKLRNEEQVEFDKLVAAVKMKEIGFLKETAVSSAGARGNMQVMPRTGVDPGYGVRPASDPNDLKELERVGVDYLRAMLRKYGKLDLALAAYNHGPGNVDNWLKDGGDYSKLPKETRDYIPIVRENYRKYGGAYQYDEFGKPIGDWPEGIDKIEPGVTPAAPDKTKVVNPSAERARQISQIPLSERTYDVMQETSDEADKMYNIRDFIPKANIMGQKYGLTDEEKGLAAARKGLDEEYGVKPEPRTPTQQSTDQPSVSEMLWSALKTIGITAGGYYAHKRRKDIATLAKSIFKKGAGTASGAALLDVGLYPVQRNLMNQVVENLNKNGGGYKVSGTDIVDSTGKVYVSHDDVMKMLDKSKEMIGNKRLEQ